MQQILILDDESAIRESLADFFDDYDIPSRQAASAEEALDILQQESFDLAIVDIRLPGMDGSSFIEQAGRLYPALAFMVHTGSMEYDLSPELQALGLTHEDVFFKPVQDLNVFLQAVRRRLSRGKTV